MDGKFLIYSSLYIQLAKIKSEREKHEREFLLQMGISVVYLSTYMQAYYKEHTTSKFTLKIIVLLIKPNKFQTKKLCSKTVRAACVEEKDDK